jgi:hypothetical protein
VKQLREPPSWHREDTLKETLSIMILNVKNRFMILISKINLKRKKEISSLMTKNRKPKMTRSSKLFSHQ